MNEFLNRFLGGALGVTVFLLASDLGLGAAKSEGKRVVLKPGLFKPLIEPPCSNCKTQHLTGLIRKDDRVVAWLRSRHNGGAVPLRHFLAGH